MSTICKRANSLHLSVSNSGLRSGRNNAREPQLAMAKPFLDQESCEAALQSVNQ